MPTLQPEGKAEPSFDELQGLYPKTQRHQWHDAKSGPTSLDVCNRLRFVARQ
jgi:hypothetical protein